MCRCGTPPFFISAVGDDDSGRSLGSGLGHIGMVRQSMTFFLLPLPPFLPTHTHKYVVALCKVLTDNAPIVACTMCDEAISKKKFTKLTTPFPFPQSLSGVLISRSHSTASYCVLLNSHGELVCGVGDMDIHSTVTPDWVRPGNSLTHHFLVKQTKNHYCRDSTHL